MPKMIKRTKRKRRRKIIKANKILKIPNLQIINNQLEYYKLSWPSLIFMAKFNNKNIK